MTTKPFFFIDLEKSWREEQHPRDTHGKFTALKGGSRVVTSTGKTGVVTKNDKGKISVKYEDGKTATLKQDNVLHENDHKKVQDAKAKKKKAKAKKAGKKQSATKQQKKADGTAKPKAIKDPTSKGAKASAKPKATKTTAKPKASTTAKASKPAKATEKPKSVKPKTANQVQNKRVKDMKAKATKENRAIREAKKKRDLEAPAIKQVAIPKNESKVRKNEQAKQNQDVKEFNTATATPENASITEMFNSAKVQKLMSKPKEKRSADEIRQLAGEITNANDKFARHMVLKRGRALGMNLASQVNRIGNKATPSERVTVQETGLYGDMLQSARATMFETLHNVMAGSQNPGAGTDMGAHVATRIKDKLKNDMYSFLNDIPIPHAVRTANADMNRAQNELAHDLGRLPSDEELGSHLMKTSKNFKEAPIVKPPYWDEKKNDWVATNKQETDPAERVRQLRAYASQQKTVSADKATNGSSSEDREVNIASNIEDQGRSPEEVYERKERQKELKGALPKAMKDMDLHDHSIRVLTMRFSQPSESRNQPFLTDQEIAQRINEEGGIDGKDISSKWVSKWSLAGMKKIQEAHKNNHPAIQQLAMLKSFVFTMILKSMYEYDLVKSLNDWGLDTSVLRHEFSRVATAYSLFDIKKSLAPNEYVGAYVLSDEGYVSARIVKHAIVASEELMKAFGEFEELQKSMFPHKGASNSSVNAKAGEYAKKNKAKIQGMAKTQQERVKQKKGALTWSEELLVKNPGSAWISWGGKRILINGDGEIKYDSRNSTHREDHNEGASEDKLEFHHENEAIEEHRKSKEDKAREAWEKEGKHKKTDRAQDMFLNQHGAKLNRETGELEFNHDDEADKHAIDHGIQAFHENLEGLKNSFGEHKSKGVEDHHHKAVGMYHKFSDEDKEAFDNHDSAGRNSMVGDHLLEQEGVRDLMDRAQQLASEGKKGAEIYDELGEELKNLGTSHDSLGMKNKAKMTTLFNQMAKGKVSEEDLAHELGKHEISRAREEANKRIVPEGFYEIGNPTNGRTMVVRIGHRMDEKKNNYTSYVKEAFDPETGQHFASEDVQQSWGRLAKELKTNAKSAEDFIYSANKDTNSPTMRAMDDSEAKDLRRNTKLGLQDEMTHNSFKLVDHDPATGRKVFAQENEDGTQNVVEVDGSGRINDPIMARLLKQQKDIHTSEDLHDVMKNAVGNRAWVTAHVGSDIHIGDALGHHVELMYDGKGAPVVASGTYKGYRYIDSRDVPKGAVDPATGEPIKALFNNGKLVDRRHSNTHKVAIAEGNAVMYNDGGKWKKGKVREQQGKAFQVVDSKGNLVGLFDKSELKQATEKGHTKSQSGNAVVKLAKNGTHRMNTNELFKPASEGKRDVARAEKAKALFQEALKKAKINTTAFDKEGNLKKDLELNDKQMARLQKVLGRSKAGKELLAGFKSSHTNELEMHVPEHLRSIVEGEGLAVGKDGTARVSTGKFEQLRDILSREGSGVSMHHKAHEHLTDYFRSKDRTKPSDEFLEQNYQPAKANTKRGEFDNHYKAQFNPNSFLMNPEAGMYKTQLEGAHHLVTRKRGIAGHGMGTGKTILGVVAGAHYKAKQLAQGQKPKKTLVVSPKGIMSDWGKEVADHTSMKALYIGSGLKGDKTHEGSGRKMWGQEGKEAEANTYKQFEKEIEDHKTGGENHDHDFHIMSYDTFMRNKDALTASGLYDNIVIDEIHAFKNQGGKRGKSLAEATDSFKNVWGLSGTPMENDAREIHSLIDTVSGGRHELGSKKEFTDEYMIKDRNGKIVGVNPTKADKLGNILANYVQFRAGEDVQYNDGSKIHFPHLTGGDADKTVQNDFVGNLADRSRDHSTNDYYGTKHSIADFEEGETTAKSKAGDEYKVRTFSPKNMSSSMAKMYGEYAKLQEKYLPKSKLQELQTATATGFDNASGKKDQNYLTAMQKLQKYINAPLANKMYVPGGSAIDSDVTGVQATGGKDKKQEPIPYEVDSEGHKRYYETDGKGGYKKDASGKPVLLAPLHHDNPKADYLKDRVSKYLDEVAKENNSRRANGKPEIMPKLVVKSSYTTFGTDIVDGVLKDLAHPVNGHPEVLRWKDKVGDKFGHGQFTGEATDREDTKTGFRGNKKNYAEEQGHLWATTVSPAGKEGVDFGNAHMMIHFDQDWNPQKMAQFTARVRRSDSAKTHAQVDRANTTRVESLHMPGTVEDFMFDAQDKKMESIKNVVESTKQREKQDKFGDTASGRAQNGRKFSRGGKRKVAPKKPKTSQNQTLPKTKKPSTDVSKVGGATTQGKSVAKAFKLVIML